ncbi:MAG: PfkB family carbohydrate kinase [Patescibacteria group bacterium]|nr:PfkB family carbohydrate kinase [Patescibacteria group bacterium]
MINTQRAKEILENAKGKPVLACGDVMLDAYLTGPVERFSQEAPVPVIRIDDEQFFPGGAGNAAACMAAISLVPHLVGVIGEKGRIKYTEVMEEEYKKCGIITHFSLDPDRKTTLKLRVKAIKTTTQHIARVDMEDTHPLSEKKENEISVYLENLAGEIKPEIISIHDYIKGFLTKKVFEKIVGISSEKNIPIFADLKQSTFVKHKSLIKKPDLFFLKPNRVESAQTAKIINGFDKDGTTDEEIIEIASIIQKEIPIHIFITRGKKGAVYFEPQKKPYFVRPKEVEEQFDIAGAGDTVAAFLIAAYLGGATMPEALELAVAASQVAIRKFGTSVVMEEELLNWIGDFPKVEP